MYRFYNCLNKLRPTILVLLSILLLLGIWSFATAPDAGQAVDGEWRERTQLVWDESTQLLVRQHLRVWDPHPQLDREFFWEPEPGNPRNIGQNIEGRGTLTWRMPGAPNYDAKSIHSRYRGELRNGRPHGHGRLETRAGLTYEGGWKNGLKHGVGQLWFENGDYYRGEFATDRPHGNGRFAAASGEFFEGRFANGKQRGPGTVGTDNEAVQTLAWFDGTLQTSQKRAVPAQWGRGDSNTRGRPSPIRQSDLVSLGVVTDQRKNRQFEQSVSSDAITYGHRSNNQSVTILPSNKDLLAIWKQGHWINEGYFTKPLHNVYAPAFLRVVVSNSSTKPKLLKSLYLQVDDSQIDNQPMLYAEPDVLPDEMYLPGAAGWKLGFRPRVRFTNVGWGGISNASISFSFAKRDQAKNVKTLSHRQNVGSFDDVVMVSVQTALKAMNVDVAQLRRARFGCPSMAEVERCMARAITKLRLGRLAPFVDTGGRNLMTTVVGQIRYDWTDSRGKTRTSTSKFMAEILLVALDVDLLVEFGAGGPEDPKVRSLILPLKLGRQNYRINLPLRRAVRIKGSKQIAFGLKAPKSSFHQFRVVAVFADGQVKESKPVRLLYFKPRFTQANEPLFP